MSCHNIGYGLNSVAKVLDELYEAGRVGKEETVILLRALAKGVHWCDGNEEEAVAWFYEKRCASCLKELEEGEQTYCLWDADVVVGGGFGNKQVEKACDDLPYDSLCGECFDRILLEAGVDADDLPTRREKGIDTTRKYVICINDYLKRR